MQASLMVQAKAGAAVRAESSGGTQRAGGSGTQVIEVFSKERLMRAKRADRPAPKILTRVQELRLLSKLESAGLLSLAEANGVTLTKLEQSGALSLAESLGLASAAADRNTPGALYTLAAALLAAGPALVAAVPDDSGALVALQWAAAAACAAGGAAAFGGASLLSTLQK